MVFHCYGSLTKVPEECLEKLNLDELLDICLGERDKYGRKINCFMLRLKIFLKQLYFVCPPFPNCVIRKIAFYPPKSSLYNFEEVESQEGKEMYRMNVCPALRKIWTLQGFDADKVLSQTVCYLLKEETDIACVHVKNPGKQPSRKVILYSHDNAVDLGMVLTTLYNIAETLNLDVISYDYPSYGLSTGKLSEKHLYRSIQCVYNFMSNKLGIDDQKIIIWGKSLGTVPSIQFSPSVNCNCLILQSSILSAYRCVIRNLTKDLCGDQLNNFSKICKVHHPTLIIHGSKDKICALRHILKMSERCPGPRSIQVVMNGEHDNLEDFSRHICDRPASVCRKMTDNCKKIVQIFRMVSGCRIWRLAGEFLVPQPLVLPPQRVKFNSIPFLPLIFKVILQQLPGPLEDLISTSSGMSPNINSNLPSCLFTDHCSPLTFSPSILIYQIHQNIPLRVDQLLTRLNSSIRDLGDAVDHQTALLLLAHCRKMIHEENSTRVNGQGPQCNCKCSFIANTSQKYVLYGWCDQLKGKQQAPRNFVIEYEKSSGIEYNKKKTRKHIGSGATLLFSERVE
ncbi:Alpha/beta hydrolase domain-containing protein 17C [Trichinella pseudospiralis]